ncbi:Hypothetical protein PHPALM_20037 [Phytophthora palmivora]|uniref:Uncharacterized protein n=1 Tax=Phytophthora palmivora TaxID=4796 RepID=A0A2P4XFX9_9STRA|nr:Hypothetical protein PHPALM_20037 [Phytophthora palmivora]
MVKARRLPLHESPLSSSEELSDDKPEEPYSDPDPTLRWAVWQIDDIVILEKSDEKTGATTSEYHVGVLWDWRPKPASKRYRSMEPLEAMLETHREECWLAMRFKSSGMEHFCEFCKTDGLDLSKFHLDMNQGCTWKQFTFFLRQLRQHRNALKINEMIKNNYVQGGRLGPRVLSELTPDKGVTDGLYIVAAYNVRFVGHAVALGVANEGQLKTVIERGQVKRVVG